ncbi:hypothetical protein [Mesorhizobium sp. NZP2298]|uniref:hypothetical protein n=1 Tax=Mesorhizobium sp. NZP2298 TaxID=2483403 RepID=UPI001555F932|nr:hypothetical protein [Mesorhizobium sp. NZP2298]QKC98266.1 hypothetical protein EB231_29170 [Mesorhizobium sp. NZP2298]
MIDSICNWNFGSISEVVSACIALAAFIGVIYEYLNARRQRRLELAQQLSYQLEQDEMLRFATTSLDWGVGLVPVPEEWRQIVDEKAIVPDRKSMQIALTPEFSRSLQQNKVALMYRHAFVALYNHLERAKDLCDKRAVLLEDLSTLGWVSAQLVDWEYAPKGLAPGFFMDALRGWYPETRLDKFVEKLAQQFPKRRTAAAHVSHKNVEFPAENDGLSSSQPPGDTHSDPESA